ncbi:MAG TPA: tetratricopeptide repeat protein, partial [Chitinophagaceae bacterium]|nr:tetratricopeptide repeat protein [Chitinophagaceae bacterium]
MAETKQTAPVTQERKAGLNNPEMFWSKYSKPLTIGLVAIILLAGGYFAYNSFFSEPKRQEAEQASFKAEEYYRADSLDKALNGDGANAGLLRIISRYDGTPAANRARLMAGSIYLKKGDHKNAVKHLEAFDSDSKQIMARATCLLGDAYSEMTGNDNKEKAAGLYKKAASMFEKDDFNAAEYLFRAGYLYESLGKNAEAIEAYKQLREKYPNSDRAIEVEKYLARL